ncbi:MAG: DUF4365 domain-containing protein [Oscillospiraceae bacterium]|nr:DUF4365 domain-containing protein [Oscillospiraceae bacterium]
MPRLTWSKLNHLQFGRYAEYYAKMEFTSYGYDVYTSEVDDHGVDFIAKSPAGCFLEVQVKAVRGCNYTYIKANKLELDDRHIVCYLRFDDGLLPDIFIIPAIVWQTPNAVFVCYHAGRSEKAGSKEFGINSSKKNAHLLESYRADRYFEKNGEDVL